MILCCFLKKNLSKSNCCFQPNIMQWNQLVRWHLSIGFSYSDIGTPEPVTGLRIPLLESSFRGRPHMSSDLENQLNCISPQSWHGIKERELGSREKMMIKWEWTEKSGKVSDEGGRTDGDGIQRDVHWEPVLSQVDQKFPLGRSVQVRSHLCILIQMVIVCSDQCSVFLTSKLVLAFFKTSCVLVTETNKQTNKQRNSSQRQKLPAGSISVLGVCVLKLVFLATKLGVSCSPPPSHLLLCLYDYWWHRRFRDITSVFPIP